MRYNSELSAAREFATKAGKILMELQNNLNHIELKEDRSPVTEADKQCERIIRDGLLASFPQDGFLGEETGEHTGTSGRRWIVDPLDGTRPFIRGIPTFSVLIALEEDNIPVLGLIYLPAMKCTCWAKEHSGAFLNGEKIHVSSTAYLKKAMGSALGFVEKSELNEGKQLFKLMRSCDYLYGFMDAYTYVCIASGKLDFCVNLLDKAWDCAAASCIIRESGGRFSDIKGIESVHNGSIILSNGSLHEQLLDPFKNT